MAKGGRTAIIGRMADEGGLMKRVIYECMRVYLVTDVSTLYLNRTNVIGFELNFDNVFLVTSQTIHKPAVHAQDAVR